MPISPFSRYASNTVTVMQDAKGVNRPTIVVTPLAPRQFSYSTYTWRSGDQIEYLAYSAYGDEQSWWYIANANPEIVFWNSVAPGTQVRIPNA